MVQPNVSSSYCVRINVTDSRESGCSAADSDKTTIAKAYMNVTNSLRIHSAVNIMSHFLYFATELYSAVCGADTHSVILYM